MQLIPSSRLCIPCMPCHVVQYFCFFQAGKGGELTHDETTIIAGALELSDKMVKDAMTPISDIFVIDINAKLDRFCSVIPRRTIR